MKTELFIIKCKSNLHVGLGDSNYGVIDKLVQRDVVNELPCIYSSSLKGGFREYFEEKLNQKKLADDIFGKGSNKKSTGMDKGAFIFQQANLLSIPLRSNTRPYFNAVSPFIIAEWLVLASLSDYSFPDALKNELDEIAKLSPKNDNPIIMEDINDLIIEDFEDFDVKPDLKFPELRKMIGNDLVILSTDDMKRITDDYHLPVIARNKLENGQSKNLWYEQIVPRESNFATFVMFNSPTGNAIKDNVFSTNVDEKIVQFGGDSSIGYGYCEVKSI